MRCFRGYRTPACWTSTPASAARGVRRAAGDADPEVRGDDLDFLSSAPGGAAADELNVFYHFGLTGRRDPLDCTGIVRERLTTGPRVPVAAAPRYALLGPSQPPPPSLPGPRGGRLRPRCGSGGRCSVSCGPRASSRRPG